MKRALPFLLFWLFQVQLTAQQGINPDPLVDVKHYEFNIEINDTTDIIYCKTKIDVSIIGSINSLYFNLDTVNTKGNGMKVSSLLCNGKVNMYLSNALQNPYAFPTLARKMRVGL